MGFATMTANAAGAVMTLYLSASGIEKRRFVGTNAWFFLIVNLTKVPFSVGLACSMSTTSAGRPCWRRSSCSAGCWATPSCAG